MLLDRSGQGKVYQLISRRRFQQMEVLEGQNILVTVSGKKNRVRVYYLSWLKSKILRTDGLSDVSTDHLIKIYVCVLLSLLIHLKKMLFSYFLNSKPRGEMGGLTLENYKERYISVS